MATFLPIAATLFIVVVAAYRDWRTGEIPNAVTLPALLLAPALYFIAYRTDGLVFSGTGLLACGLMPYLMFRLGAMGGGDVKLFAALGAINGLELGATMLLLSLLVGCVQALVMLLARGELVRVLGNSFRLAVNPLLPQRHRREVPVQALTQLRLGPAILAGTLVATTLGAWM